MDLLAIAADVIIMATITDGGFDTLFFFLLILLFITFSGALFFGPNDFNSTYLDKKSTTAINGVFIKDIYNESSQL